MERKFRNWFISLVLLLTNQVFCDDISLQGALNSINRRQHNMADYPKYGQFYSESGVSHYNVPDNDLIFLGPSDSRKANKEMSPFDYLEELDYPKQISSPFRERTTQENRLREKQKLAEIILNEAKSSEYADLLRELYQKYDQIEPQSTDYYSDSYDRNELRKRSRHYGNMGLNAVGMRKRSQKYPLVDESNEAMYLLNVPSMRDQTYTSSVAKRFPVTKRSSTYYPIPFANEMPRQFKRSSNKDDKFLQTDPKVAEDLSSIFSNDSNRKDAKPVEENKVVAKPKKTEHVTETSKTTTPEVKSTTTEKPETKETITDAKIDEKEKPIQVKKKSIDWSDYFGVDKRKKSDNLDNDWLMERYHKAIAISEKRNSENVDENGGEKANKSRSLSSTDEKISDMDAKLKNIEYAIVDDALKATKIQETNTKETQDMKDKVISQLAAAYSLEKMRRALNEYRESIKKGRIALKDTSKNENRKLEEKRLSVPRKSAGDIETVTAKNNIKCSNGNEKCVEKTYDTPEDLLNNYNFGYCPKVQKACAEIASILGAYERVLELACTIYEMCLLCGDSTWFSPARQCNSLFLNKVEYLCSDDLECKEVAHHSTRYLLELNKLLKSESLGMCELGC